MDLKHGAVYRAPDGRIFRALMEVSRYGRGLAWTFAPLGLEQEVGRMPTRDRLSQLLFFEDGKLFAFNFISGAMVRDTGWTLADLVLVVSAA